MVSARGKRAIIVAGLGVADHAEHVARLPRRGVHVAIAASLERTIGVTANGVAWTGIAFFVRCHIDDVVTTTFQPTARATAVAIGPVTVVAILADGDVHDEVSARLVRETVRATGVTALVVTVVADLTVGDDPIPATPRPDAHVLVCGAHPSWWTVQARFLASSDASVDRTGAAHGERGECDEHGDSKAADSAVPHVAFLMKSLHGTPRFVIDQC
jgi:hypothetical protein